MRRVRACTIRCRCHSRYPDLRKVVFAYQLQNQLRIVTVRLLLAHPLATDLGRVPDPQLKVELCQQSLKPACVATGFHPYTHLQSLGCELTVELFRFLTVLQCPLLQFPSFGIHIRNLLEARVIIASYNDHCSAPSSRAFFGWFQHHQSLLGSKEPTLSWNQLHSEPPNERNQEVSTVTLPVLIRLHQRNTSGSW